MFDDSDPKERGNAQEISAQSQTISVTAWECFSTAIQFLTRLPVGGAMDRPLPFYQEALKKSVVYFPVVGGLIGIVTTTIAIGASQLFDPWIAAILAIAIEALITGAFHEDAFADSFDGFGGGWTREQVLEIMKDSRLGTYGTMGLILGVGLRIATTATILSASDSIYWMAATTIAAGSLCRLSIVFMMSMTPPIQDRHSQARDVSGMQNRSTCLLATLFSLPFWTAWLIAKPGIAATAILASCLVLLWFRHKIIRRIGGTTGDTLGCTCYLVHLVLLTVSAANLES